MQKLLEIGRAEAYLFVGQVLFNCVFMVNEVAWLTDWLQAQGCLRSQDRYPTVFVTPLNAFEMRD
jgi:hypothetical protein